MDIVLVWWSVWHEALQSPVWWEKEGNGMMQNEEMLDKKRQTWKEISYETTVTHHVSVSNKIAKIVKSDCEPSSHRWRRN